MVAYYEIFGRKVGSHVLSMATMGTVFGGAWLATRGGGEKKTEQGPPIAASSKDEEQFVQEFLKNVDGGEDKKEAKH